jgi:hypothetical protein
MLLHSKTKISFTFSKKKAQKPCVFPYNDPNKKFFLDNKLSGRRTQSRNGKHNPMHKRLYLLHAVIPMAV